MSHHYTDQQKQQILDQLRANNGNVSLTASHTGVHQRTLWRWRQEAGIESRLVAPVSPSSTVTVTPMTPIVTNSPPLTDAALVTELRDLQTRMLGLTHQLLKAIPQAINAAPLNQQVAALAQLTDRIIKLATELPQPPEEIDYEAYIPPLEQPTPEDAESAAAASEPTADPAE